MQVKKTTLIILSGMLWLLIGSILLPVGVRFLLESPDYKVAFLFVLGVSIGYLKGRFVLARTVKKAVQRFVQMETPSLSKIYTYKYYLLILAMMGLGMSLQFFKVPREVRGTIDIAVGSALIYGAIVYFGYAKQIASSDTN